MSAAIVLASVKVANFSSVLEIVFAINFVTLLLDLKPYFDSGIWGLNGKYKELLKKAWRGKEPVSDSVRLTTPFVLYIAVDSFGCAATFAVSAFAVFLLIATGFHAEWMVHESFMAQFLLMGFVTPIAYYVLASWVKARLIGRFETAEKKYTAANAA